MKKVFIILVVVFNAAYSLLLSQTTWVRVTDSIPNLVIMSMQFTSETRGYACGSYYTMAPGAFLRTTSSGLTWQVTQFPHVSVDALSFVDQNTGYLSCWGGVYYTRSYVYKTTDGGNNWIVTDSLGTSFFNIKFFDANTGCVVAKHSVNHFTADGGYTWTTQSNGDWWEPRTLLCLNADTWLVATGSPHVAKTTNRGSNWYSVYFGSGYYVMSISFPDLQKGFAVTYNGKVFKSTNKGDNWVQISDLGKSNLYDACIMFPDSLTGYVSYWKYIFKTTNGGYYWDTMQVSSTADLYTVYFLNENTGFTGGNHGFIYRTTNGGVWVQPSPEIPSVFSLSQNYPNPFNPTTNIKFDVAKSGPVKLTVFDITGREVQTLVNENLQAGTYEVTFDGSGLNSGVYLYRMVTDKYSETKRAVLIK